LFYFVCWVYRLFIYSCFNVYLCNSSSWHISSTPLWTLLMKMRLGELVYMWLICGIFEGLQGVTLKWSWWMRRYNIDYSGLLSNNFHLISHFLYLHRLIRLLLKLKMLILKSGMMLLKWVRHIWYEILKLKTILDNLGQQSMPLNWTLSMPQK